MCSVLFFLVSICSVTFLFNCAPLSFIAVGRSPRYKVECFRRFRAYSYNSRKYHDCA
ncbi:unnamed protein product [Ixodes pacificus]